MTLPPATVAELMALARSLGLERLDAHQLLAHHLHCSRAWLLAHDDEALPPASLAAATQALQRCAAGEPLAYVLGEQAFHGLVLQVSPAVLIPRPDTETLVDWALDLLAGPWQAEPAPQVLDLGTGSGAVALAVKHGCPRAQLNASDISTAALDMAQANAERLGLALECRLGDWWQPWPLPLPQPLHLALSNPPYIDADDPHLPALAQEPTVALVPGDGDGLSALRQIVVGAAPRLQPGGWLLLEHGHRQAEAVAALLQQQGFTQIQHRSDRGHRQRCTGGCWPGR